MPPWHLKKIVIKMVPGNFYNAPLRLKEFPWIRLADLSCNVKDHSENSLHNLHPNCLLHCPTRRRSVWFLTLHIINSDGSMYPCEG